MRSADSEHQEPLVLMARSAPAALGKAWWPAAALVFGVAVIYGPTIASLARMWWSSDDYSHGILVPFISLYFVWMKRDVIARTDATPSVWLGVPVIAAAGLLLHAGKIGGVMVLQEISLL
ncbi:MAG TPA: archaeosortase/exosortase family protein, partial [Nitrospiria bacterium]|nr:archaeosortase/exosortase family protein [Nitrospiria bacterium]